MCVLHQKGHLDSEILGVCFHKEPEDPPSWESQLFLPQVNRESHGTPGHPIESYVVENLNPAMELGGGQGSALWVRTWILLHLQGWMLSRDSFQLISVCLDVCSCSECVSQTFPVNGRERSGGAGHVHGNVWACVHVSICPTASVKFLWSLMLHSKK